MTTPGVPARRPGSTTPPDTDVLDYVRRLEERVAELERRDMTNSTVGQGGTFRGFYDNGQMMFTYGADKDDVDATTGKGVRKVRVNYASNGKRAFHIGPGNASANEPEQLQIRDQSGGQVFATDGIAGYGLAEPSFTYFMSVMDAFARTNGVEDFACESHAFFYNPALWSRVRIAELSGITGGSARLVVRDATGTIRVSSSTSSFGTGISTISKIVLLPSDMINAQNCKAQWLITPTGSGTLRAYPLMCKGTSKVFYDINAGDQ